MNKISSVDVVTTTIIQLFQLLNLKIQITEIEEPHMVGRIEESRRQSLTLNRCNRSTSYLQPSYYKGFYDQYIYGDICPFFLSLIVLMPQSKLVLMVEFLVHSNSTAFTPQSYLSQEAPRTHVVNDNETTTSSPYVVGAFPILDPTNLPYR